MIYAFIGYLWVLGNPLMAHNERRVNDLYFGLIMRYSTCFYDYFKTG